MTQDNSPAAPAEDTNKPRFFKSFNELAYEALCRLACCLHLRIIRPDRVFVYKCSFFEDKSRSITFWIVFQSFQPFSLADLRYIAEINARIKEDSPPAVFEHYILDLSQARKAAAPNIQALKTAKLSYRIHVCGNVVFEENSLPLFEEGTADRPFALMLLWAHYAMICDLQDMNRM